MYSVFWVKTDDVNEIQRLNYYKGIIEKVDCSAIDVSRGGTRHELSVLLNTGEYLNFRFPLKTCRYFYRKVPFPRGLELEAYFQARRLMQLRIDGKELVSFDEEKRFDNRFAFGLIVFPFAVYFLGKYMQRKKQSGANSN